MTNPWKDAFDQAIAEIKLMEVCPANRPDQLSFYAAVACTRDTLEIYRARTESKLASAPLFPVALTYSSTQETECAGCGQRKHTPLRRDEMGGYVCLTCIDKRLDALKGGAEW